jgi:hypothetical protein
MPYSIYFGYSIRVDTLDASWRRLDRVSLKAQYGLP